MIPSHYVYVYLFCGIALLLTLVGTSYAQVIDSPRVQFLEGKAIDEILCNTGLELVMKKTTGAPACVLPTSVEELIQRGWALHVLPERTEGDVNSEIYVQGSLEVESADILYSNGTGFLAKPEGDGGYPGVVMIHEWWGLNEDIKRMAQTLASHGYVVLAVDLYGDTATTPEEARLLVTNYTVQDGIKSMNDAVDHLVEKHGVQSVGSIGWCFGGAQSLQLAMNNPKMNATVIYYGAVTSDTERLAGITWPVLGIFAEMDAGITVQSVNEFEEALDRLEIQNDIHIFEGVDHAFANPSGERYAPEQAMQAWDLTLGFFEENLR